MIARFGSAPVTRVTGLCFVPCPAGRGAGARAWPLWSPLWAFLGAANGVMDVAMNAHGVAVETRLQQPIMSSLHGMFSLGGLLGAGGGALALGYAAAGCTRRWPARWCCWWPLVAMRWLLPGRVDVGDAGPHFVLPSRAALGLRRPGVPRPDERGRGPRLERCLAARRSRRQPDAWPALAFAAFSAAMAVGRFGGDRLRRRWGAAILVRGSACSPRPAWRFAVLVATPIAAILGFACAGLGLSNTVPVLFGAAGRLPGMQPGAGIAATASIGYLGFLVGPPLIGFAAQATSLGRALGLLVVACGLVAMFASLVRVADDRAGPAEQRGRPVAPDALAR